MDKAKLANTITEIVAMRLDVRDQRDGGVWPQDTDLGRWKQKYRGVDSAGWKQECRNALRNDWRPPSPATTISHFRLEVDEFVAVLMRAIDDAICPGLNNSEADLLRDAKCEIDRLHAIIEKAKAAFERSESPFYEGMQALTL